LSYLGTGSSGGMPVGVTVRLYRPGVEKNITSTRANSPRRARYSILRSPHLYSSRSTIEIGRNARRLPTKGLCMFKSQQYRAKATEYGELVRLRPAPRTAVNFKNWNDASLRWRRTSRSSRTITRVQCTFRTMTNPAARPWPLRKNTFCGVLGRRSSCNGTSYRRRYNGRSSTPPVLWASCWRQRRCGDRSPGFCTSTRMIAVATN
jgi:hypothetical protein